MKKYLSIFISFVLVFLIIGYTVMKDRAVLPPTRIAESKSYPTLACLYDFKTAIEDSELIAHVKIGDWLGEDDNATYYEATIIKQFKGIDTDKIVLIQEGCSDYTIAGYPLFTNENELLVFLKTGEMSEYENLFWIIGAYTTVLYAVSDDSGNVYYMDRDGTLSRTAHGIINNIPQNSFAFELYEKLIKKDPFLAVNMPAYAYFYSEKDLMNLINEQCAYNSQNICTKCATPYGVQPYASGVESEIK